MSEGIDITLTLDSETQFVATEVDGIAAVHVGIGESGFTLTGEHEALRSLANMILHALDDNCPQCKSESTKTTPEA